MFRFRYSLVAGVLFFLMTSPLAFAQEDATPEVAAEAPSAEQAEQAAVPEAPPAPVSLIAGMTVDEMMKSVNAPAMETYRGTVTDFVTGAILVIDRNGSALTARLYGIDSPEPGQAYYQEARQFAVDKFLNESVNVSVLAIDSQQNPVVLVFNTNGESLSHLMVAQGMAWWDRRNAQKDALLRRLNADAISNSVGLYADPLALAPWDFRDSHGMEQFTYTVNEQEAAKPAPRTTPPAAEEPRTLAAKGTMTENVPRGGASLPKDLGKDIDPVALMGKHMPTIATDDAGNPLGLTATNISQIPYASQFGFQDNDIISNVNGIAVQSIPQIMNMAPQFKDTKQFTVEVIRNGQRITIPVTIP
jgi:micrococcal nuclease